MDTSQHLPSPHERPPSIQDILQVWRDDRCIRESSAQQYLQWVNRFRRYCLARSLVEGAELTRNGAKRFLAWYMRSHRINTDRLGVASSALRALRRVHEVMGRQVLPWRLAEQRRPPSTAILRDYIAHLGQHLGNPEVTIRKKLRQVGKLLEFLGRSGKSWRQLSLPDIDAFLIEYANHYARSTTADIASTVRCFARFLLVSGRIHVDLASAVISPVQPSPDISPRKGIGPVLTPIE